VVATVRTWTLITKPRSELSCRQSAPSIPMPCSSHRCPNGSRTNQHRSLSISPPGPQTSLNGCTSASALIADGGRVDRKAVGDLAVAESLGADEDDLAPQSKRLLVLRASSPPLECCSFVIAQHTALQVSARVVPSLPPIVVDNGKNARQGTRILTHEALLTRVTSSDRSPRRH
jgi:hypothetical protein